MVEFQYKTAELGTRQHSRDNVKMFLGQTIVDYCIMSIFVAAASSFRHQVPTIFWIFTCQWSSTELRCGEAKQLSCAQLWKKLLTAKGYKSDLSGKARNDLQADLWQEQAGGQQPSWPRGRWLNYSRPFSYNKDDIHKTTTFISVYITKK